jgi:DMSO/TMAO reductase YedYZ molybdopterin-dependent catalytic subunit
MRDHGPVTNAEVRAAAAGGTGPGTGSRGRAALAGLLTGAAGWVVSLTVTAVAHQRLSPPYAVAEAVVEATPGRLARAAIDVLGRWDKPLLAGGVLVVLAVLSAVAGLLARSRVRHGQLVFLVTAAIAAGAVLTRPQAGVVTLAPTIAGAVTWFVVLPFLVPSADAHNQPVQRSAAPEQEAASRRAFLLRSAVVAAGTLVVGVGSRFLGRRRREVEAARSALDLPVTTGRVPAGAEVGVAGVVPWRVANEDFYRIDTALVVPAVDVDRWRLRIHGLVDRELSFTFRDLLDRQLTETWITLCCVSNPVGGELVGNAWWSGVRVADLLAEAGADPRADAVLQTSEDGWTCGTPLAALTDDRDALLAVAMNGRPLPLEHGFPVRMVVPGLFGFVSATKWLVDLEVTRFADFEAFWTRRGWAAKGPVRTQSRIDVPRAHQGVLAGDVTVAGVAWAQHTGIEAVEVRLDGGPWAEMELGRVPSVDTWVQWSGTVRLDRGVHTLAVRARDRSGYTQTGVRRDVVPDGATGWHTIELTAE